VAGRQTLELADGTRVELNARTSLEVRFDGQARRVRLAAGEAFFAVHKEPDRPFLVETPGGTVRVTGTHFDVRADSEAPFEVTVVEGSVQAQPTAAAPVALVGGQQLTAGPEGPQVRPLSPAAIDDALAWRHGQIVFADARLDTALARFARYHGRPIRASADAAALHIGGRYSLDDLDGFFAALEEILPVRVVPQGADAVEIRLRTEP
jgi:transmembrane sensor